MTPIAAFLAMVLMAGPVLADATHAEGQPILLSTSAGELCARCTGALRCVTLARDRAPTVYAFHAQAWWRQVVRVFSDADMHKRPVTITTAGLPPREETARLHRDAALIEVADASGAPTRIDRLNGGWLSGDEKVLGYCTAVQPTTSP